MAASVSNGVLFNRIVNDLQEALDRGMIMAITRRFFEDLTDEDLRKLNDQIRKFDKHIVIHESKSYELQDL